MGVETSKFRVFELYPNWHEENQSKNRIKFEIHLADLIPNRINSAYKLT